MGNVEKLVLKHVLLNAAQYSGKANPGSVIGAILGEDPGLKKDMATVGKLVGKTVKEVNSWNLDKQAKELKKFGNIEKPKREVVGLPELEGVKKGKVIMRIAPNPNGPPHIGHARMMILNDEYVKRYKGKLILRLDDTDPKNPNKLPMKEAYKWMEEGLTWLGIKIDRIERASARLDRYYEVFKQMLQDGFAYVCVCDQAEWSQNVRRNREACDCRGMEAEENLDRWERVLKHDLKEGQAVGRIKTGLDEKDPAVIDWVSFRIIDNPLHPHSKAHVWPMLDFASAVDDYDFGITHILRGKDLVISEKRQRIMYTNLGWDYPHTFVYGKFMTTEDMIISKSKILSGLDRGLFTGWDDPRLVTLMALRKRGITPEAIRNYIVNLGLKQHETTVDLKILYSLNRDMIDKKSDRYFFVSQPLEIVLENNSRKEAKAPTYPGGKKFRKIPVGKKIFIEKHDFVGNRGREVRLMHFCNVKLDKKSKVTSIRVKDVPKIHWIGSRGVKVKLVMDTGAEVIGLAEPEIKKVKVGDWVQFERIGYARCDSVKPEIVFFFSHR